MDERLDFEKTLREIESLRPAASHKGNYGKVTILGGSSAYPGAPLLSASASLAYRGGSGYVTLALPKSLIPSARGLNPELLLESVNEDSEGFLSPNEEDYSKVLRSDAIAFGMGTGWRTSTKEIALSLINHCTSCLLLDADALNSLSGEKEFVCPPHSCALILTPHLKEFSRLSGIEVSEVEKHQKELCEEYARKWNCVLVLKSNTTAISDGSSTYWVTSGNAGLAKAGSGDTLSGLIVGLAWASKKIPWVKLAATASTWMGKAAENFAKEHNGLSFLLTPEDVVKEIPKVLTKENR